MDWAEQVSRVDDLIRGVMAASGESREITAEMVDAAEAMDQEAVLNSTEGEPTTLEDAPPEDVTRLEIDVRWSPRGDSSYYHRDERADLLKGWIESALCDRADSPEVVSFKAS